MKLNKIFYILYYIFLLFFIVSQAFYFKCSTQVCHFIGIWISIAYQILEPMIVFIFIWLFLNAKHIFVITLPLVFAVLLEYYFKESVISSDYFDNKTIYLGSLVLQDVPTYEILFVLSIIQIFLLLVFRKKLSKFVSEF
ncbi:hypothetical protein [Sulfurovum mangrovi]|uniref:hypothetical protein n=1 Tax=Sulfurovum mangrovi TaxID=2893889 RepID=UPI001E5A6A5F|nr:hypothetical protein [Sulfurovum mangrovi]UFH60181.1 hypothetical protein LN246_04865 [Sulfurovum mangrovi]